jgi:nitronate monooxygenase
MVIDRLRTPVVLAPLAGGPSTPELAAAVSNAGGLGFVAAGYLSAQALKERIATTRRLTDGPIGVNVFAPGAGPTDAATYAPFVALLERWAAQERVELDEARYSDDDWEAKLELLAANPPEVVSFTFGCPTPKEIERLTRAGSEVWATVTAPEEARFAEQAGAQVLVVQGAEAGGHRASFTDRPDLPLYALLPLLALVRSVVALPLVASGGIASGESVAAVLAAGASAAQIGTSFMLAPEAGTSSVHREALQSNERTVLTRAFTGRLARGIRNRFTAEQSADAPIAYPELHYVTAPMRKRAREAGDAGLINLWAGEAHQLARELPAAEIVARLASEAKAPGGSPADQLQLHALAAEWYEAWNAHDLDRVLSHYTDDVVFRSPFIAALGVEESGVLVGKEPLRAYWTLGLERFPDLHFEPIRELFGVGGVTLHYRSDTRRVAEVLEVNDARLVFRSAAYYDQLP